MKLLPILLLSGLAGPGIAQGLESPTISYGENSSTIYIGDQPVLRYVHTETLPPEGVDEIYKGLPTSIHSGRPEEKC